MDDLGLTHVALTVADVDRSIEFYRRYAAMSVVHRRTDEVTGHSVVWLSDRTRPFALVLLEADPLSPPLGGSNHLGIGVESRAEVDRRVADATAEGRSTFGPNDHGFPVGYWAIIADPDGHNLELSHGQEVGLAVEQGDVDAG